MENRIFKGVVEYNPEEAIRARKDKEKEFNYHKNHGINLSKNEYRSK